MAEPEGSYTFVFHACSAQAGYSPERFGRLNLSTVTLYCLVLGLRPSSKRLGESTIYPEQIYAKESRNDVAESFWSHVYFDKL